MSSININEAIKRYGNLTIIDKLNVHIPDGSLFTLLGPSGCGKTTLLRMIAGFNTIEGGDFYFDETRINDLDPSKRDIGMVFQNYAIFPHMSVEENVRFGLYQRKLDKQEIEKRSDKFLKLMQIDQYRNRLPENLSGGQQQRVALARALVIEPKVLLMDEPLSNLDAKLRVDMRSAIRDIQKNVGITTVYVTHDQEEAMAISDYIAVMKDGEIQHLGTPKEIYQRPHNEFVATFIGRTNIIESTMNEGQITIGNYTFNVPNLNGSGKVKLSIRPEEFVINSEKGIKATIVDSIFLGLNTHYYLSLESGEKVEVIEESSINHLFEKGSIVYLDVKREKINVFDESGLRNLVIDNEKA